MKFLRVISITLSFLLFLPLLVVESSSLRSENFMSNITRGSSLYSNDTSPYWLSPSGNIAFGFYQLPCTRSSPNCPDRYVVGIWFVKSPLKTLVWTANHNDLPLRIPSSILLNNEGKLMLQIMSDNKEKPLISDIQEQVSYAMVHDDGNFVLYGSHSQIIWESFDYPTETILGGQKLRPGVDLISDNHRLSVQQTNGLVAICRKTNFDLIGDDQGELSAESVSVISDALKSSSISRPVILNLDIAGNLYLVGADDVILKYLYGNKKQQEEGSDLKEDVYVYRATMDSGAHFNLYKERIDGNISSNDHNGKSSSTQVLLWPIHHP